MLPTSNWRTTLLTLLLGCIPFQIVLGVTTEWPSIGRPEPRLESPSRSWPAPAWVLFESEEELLARSPSTSTAACSGSPPVGCVITGRDGYTGAEDSEARHILWELTDEGTARRLLDISGPGKLSVSGDCTTALWNGLPALACHDETLTAYAALGGELWTLVGRFGGSAISARGDVAFAPYEGFAECPEPDRPAAVVWKDGTVIDLGDVQSYKLPPVWHPDGETCLLVSRGATSLDQSLNCFTRDGHLQWTLGGLQRMSSWRDGNPSLSMGADLVAVNHSVVDSSLRGAQRRWRQRILTVLDDRGRILWESRAPRPDGVVGCCVSEDGSTVYEIRADMIGSYRRPSNHLLLRCREGRKGDLLGEASVPPWPLELGERRFRPLLLGLCPSPSGSMVLVVVRDSGDRGTKIACVFSSACELVAWSDAVLADGWSWIQDDHLALAHANTTRVYCFSE